MNSEEKILNEYVNDKPTYDALEKMTNGLLTALISNAGLVTHIISSRVKAEDSLKNKIRKPEKNYKYLSDFTDIVGIRITTYFQDDVDRISDIINREFIVDQANSIDKRKALEPDRFGYMSLHLVVQYSDERIKLPEYEHIKGIKFEIQIRTILQHAWAEIEHDIGYKSDDEVPAILKRKFSRLSGLLELADEEFLAIKNKRLEYKTDLKTNVGADLSKIMLDLDSIEHFISSNETLKKIENEFKSEVHFSEEKRTSHCLGRSIKSLKCIGILTVEDLSNAYCEVEEYMLPFLKEWMKQFNKSDVINVRSGASLLYVCYIILALRDDNALFESFFLARLFKERQEKTIKDRIKKTFKNINSQ
jgi:putative GTP pyrophosphokinase